MSKFFDGSNDDISGTLTEIAALEQWTMFAWIRLAANLGTGVSWLIGELGTGSAFRQHFGITRSGSSNVPFGRQDYTTTDARHVGTRAIVADTWTFVAAQFDFAPLDANPKRIHLYIGDLDDEVAEDSSATLETFGSGTKVAGGSTYTVGSSNAGANRFNGDIAMFGVVPYRIPRASLDAIRHGRRLGYFDFAPEDVAFDPRLILPLDSPADAQAEDLSGYGNNGTVNGGATASDNPPVPVSWGD